MNEPSAVYGLFGVGGFAREVMPIVRQIIEKFDKFKKNKIELLFVVENLEKEFVTNGYRVINISDFISIEAPKKYFNVAIADYRVRKRLSKILLDTNIKPFTIKAPNSVILDDNDIGEGAIFCHFTTVTSNAKIGRFFQSNIYSYVAHDCVIGDFVTFAPNVHCNGNVVIEDHAYIGTGAIIKNGTENNPIVIGENAVVGMGAVVTKSVPSFTTVVGNPAKELVG